MRVDSITLRRLRMRLKAPFETSFGITSDRPILLVELVSDGFAGWSEVTATEGPFFNAESVDIAALVLRDVLIPLVLGKTFASADQLPAAFSAVRGHEMARAESENALWDVEAKHRGLP